MCYSVHVHVPTHTHTHTHTHTGGGGDKRNADARGLAQIDTAGSMAKSLGVRDTRGLGTWPTLDSDLEERVRERMTERELARARVPGESESQMPYRVLDPKTVYGVSNSKSSYGGSEPRNLFLNSSSSSPLPPPLFGASQSKTLSLNSSSPPPLTLPHGKISANLVPQPHSESKLCSAREHGV